MEKYITLLKNTSIFAGTNEEEILSILHCMNAKKMTKLKDSYILRVGESTNDMGLLLSGSALIVQEDVWGHRNIIAKINPGDTFAESFAASQGAVLNVSVIANEACEILRLNISRILSVCPSRCEHHNRIIRNLVSTLAHKTLIFNDKITHMSKRTTREKLLSYLSAESLRQGRLSFVIPYDRQQLADFLCVERSAMSAELSKLQKEGIIKYTKNEFTLFSNKEGDENIY